MRILVSRWPLDTLNLGSDSLLCERERERKSGVISSELCSRKIPRILLCQMVRCGFVSQICSHMLGLKDVHKDLAEMKRKISFIALLLPRDRSFQKTLSYILHMGLRGLAWLDHVQGAGSAAPKAIHPSIVPQKRNRSRRLKSCEVALGGRRVRRRTLLLFSSSSTITRLAKLAQKKPFGELDRGHRHHHRRRHPFL